MANAAIDDNNRTSMTALLNTNGLTVTRVCADPTNSNSLCVDDASTGSDSGGTYIRPDDNSAPAAFAPGLLAYSSAGDGSLVTLYCDSSGKLLVDSN